MRVIDEVDITLTSQAKALLLAGLTASIELSTGRARNIAIEVVLIRNTTSTEIDLRTGQTMRLGVVATHTNTTRQVVLITGTSSALPIGCAGGTVRQKGATHAFLGCRVVVERGFAGVAGGVDGADLAVVHAGLADRLGSYTCSAVDVEPFQTGLARLGLVAGLAVGHVARGAH